MAKSLITRVLLPVEIFIARPGMPLLINFNGSGSEARDEGIGMGSRTLHIYIRPSTSPSFAPRELRFIFVRLKCVPPDSFCFYSLFHSFIFRMCICLVPLRGSLFLPGAIFVLLSSLLVQSLAVVLVFSNALS